MGRFPRNAGAVSPPPPSRRLFVVDDGEDAEGGGRHVRVVLVPADPRHLVFRRGRIGALVSLRLLRARQQRALRYARRGLDVSDADRAAARRCAARDDRRPRRISLARARRSSRASALHHRTHTWPLNCVTKPLELIRRLELVGKGLRMADENRLDKLFPYI